MYDTDDLDDPTRPAPDHLTRGDRRPHREPLIPRVTPRTHPIPTTGHGLQARLGAEWEHLRRQPDMLATARSWGLTDQPVDDLDDVLTSAGFDVPRSRACDQVLAALVRLAPSDVLATRIVLQRLMPGLLARGRLRRQRGRRGEVFEELVGAAWITIRDYDPDRRPSCLAAALIDGADYWAFGRDDRRRTVDETFIEPHQFDRHTLERHASPCDELAALVRDTRADGATDDDLGVVIGLVEIGNPTELAAALGITTRTVRNRRDRITQRMRRVALAA